MRRSQQRQPHDITLSLLEGPHLWLKPEAVKNWRRVIFPGPKQSWDRIQRQFNIGQFARTAFKPKIHDLIVCSIVRINSCITCIQYHVHVRSILHVPLVAWERSVYTYVEEVEQCAHGEGRIDNVPSPIFTGMVHLSSETCHHRFHCFVSNALLLWAPHSCWKSPRPRWISSRYGNWLLSHKSHHGLPTMNHASSL